jgi:hypothetical protein
LDGNINSFHTYFSIKKQTLVSTYVSTLVFPGFSQSFPEVSTRQVAYICSRYYRAPELIFGATN